jgi:hypothetical protein
MKAPPLAYFLFVLFVQDIETFDLEDFKYNFVNMTAFRIVDAEDVGVREILKDMERFQPVGHSILNKSRIIQVGHYQILLFTHCCVGYIAYCVTS